MKIAEIRKLSTKDLATESTKLREEITELRRHLYSGETTNVRALRLQRVLERGGVRFEETDATADVPEEETVEERK
jgi:hypothetical protein